MSDWNQDEWDNEHPEDPEDFEGTGMREDEFAVELARRGEQPDNPALDKAREEAERAGTAVKELRARAWTWAERHA